MCGHLCLRFSNVCRRLFTVRGKVRPSSTLLLRLYYLLAVHVAVSPTYTRCIHKKSKIIASLKNYSFLPDSIDTFILNRLKVRTSFKISLAEYCEHNVPVSFLFI